MYSIRYIKNVIGSNIINGSIATIIMILLVILKLIIPTIIADTTNTECIFSILLLTAISTSCVRSSRPSFIASHDFFLENERIIPFIPNIKQNTDRIIDLRSVPFSIIIVTMLPIANKSSPILIINFFLSYNFTLIFLRYIFFHAINIFNGIIKYTGTFMFKHMLYFVSNLAPFPVDKTCFK